MSVTKTLNLTLFLLIVALFQLNGQAVINLDDCGVPYIDPQDEGGSTTAGQDTLIYQTSFDTPNQLRYFYIDINAFGGQQVDRVFVEALLPDGSTKALGNMAFGGCSECLTGFALVDNDSLITANVTEVEFMNLWIESLNQPPYTLPSNLQTLTGVGRLSGSIPFCAIGWRVVYIVSSNPASTSTEFSTYIHCPVVIDPCEITADVSLDCPSDQLLISANIPSVCFGPDLSVTWTSPQGEEISQANANLPITGNIGWWNIEITDDCCTYRDSILIENPPFTDAGEDQTVCQGATIFIAGEGGFDHYWEIPPNNDQADSLINLRNIQPEDAGAYILHAFNEEGCEDIDTMELSVLVPPIPELQLSEGCLGDDFLMSVPNDSLFTSIQWISPLGVAIGSTISDLQPDDFGDYVLVVTDPQGCEVRDTFAVAANALPEFFFVTEPACDSTRVFLAPDTLQYDWENGVTGPQFATADGGEFLLTITDEVGCTSTATIPIPPPDGPAVTLEIDQPVCPRETGRIQINPADPNMPLIFSIDGGETYSLSRDFRGLEPGDYPVVIQDELGCLRQLEVMIESPDTLAVWVDVERLDVRPGTPVSFSAETIGNIQIYQWIPDIIDTGQPLTEFTATNDLDIRIIVEDDRGCKASDGFPLNIVLGDVYTPNVFSPNQDGINDRFTLYSDNGSLEIIESLRVFDRWGGMVFEKEEFEISNVQLGWDGTKDGELMRPGIYTYYGVVRFGNGVRKRYEGGVLLIR